MITAKDISIGYGQKVIREGISFDAPQGECILLCGANGTGKSTLLRTIAGLIPIPGSKGSTATDHKTADIMLAFIRRILPTVHI